MKMQVALFDVDGTIINGNCTKIFLQYLFHRNLIVQNEFYPVYNKFNLYLSSDISYSEVILEATNIFSKLNIDELRKHWSICFRDNIKNKLNKKVLNRIRKFQDLGIEIILASGSHIELVSLVASALNIKEENIIATESKMINQHLVCESTDKVCYGENKKKQVIEHFKTKGFNLKNSYFFTDNLSDFNLLTLAGKSYWCGSEELYLKHSMAESGIKKLNTSTLSDIREGKLLNTNRQLYNYYLKNKSVIEESVYDIFPTECTPQTMDFLVGKIDLSWDYETLQKTFFNPFHEYLNQREEKIISMGTCLFLESCGVDTNHYRLLIGMGELLDISGEIFIDIKDWTSFKKSQMIHKSHLDISVIGNVAIALISLPVHNIIFNRTELDDEKKLLLYESYTSIIFNTLFGNGLKLFWENQKSINVSFQEYCKVAFLTNMGLLKIPGNLWLILQREKPSEASAETMDTFIKNMSIAIQLQKDLLAFDKWEKQLDQSKMNRFNFLNNILCIHAANHFNNPAIFSDNFSIKQMKKILDKSGSFTYAQRILSEFSSKANGAMELLPIKVKYKELIQGYSRYLAFK